jgi:hypothetical protein
LERPQSTSLQNTIYQMEPSTSFHKDVHLAHMQISRQRERGESKAKAPSWARTRRRAQPAMADTETETPPDPPRDAPPAFPVSAPLPSHHSTPCPRNLPNLRRSPSLSSRTYKLPAPGTPLDCCHALNQCALS